MNYFDSEINICLKNFLFSKEELVDLNFWYFSSIEKYFFLLIILTFLLKKDQQKKIFTFAKLFPMLIFAIPFYAALDDYMMLTSGLWQLVPIIISFFTDIRGMELEFTIFGLIAEIVLLIF